MSIYDNPRNFGLFLRELRERNQWTQREVADLLGLKSQSSVMHLENGQVLTKLTHVSIIAKELDIPASVLLAMFEYGTLETPCRCVCHYHGMSADATGIVRINNAECCALCHHSDTDCEIYGGLYFVKDDTTFNVN